MKASVLDPQVTLYKEPDTASAPIAQLLERQEFEVTGTTTRNGQTWAIVTLPDGSLGYALGATKIYQLRVARLTETVGVYEEACAGARLLRRYPFGTLLLILDTSDPIWIKVRTADGVKGFIPQGSGMMDPRRSAAGVAAARRHMWVGGAWCVGGIVVTVYTYAAASDSRTYVVAWGAIIFGCWRFLKGLAKFMEG